MNQTNQPPCFRPSSTWNQPSNRPASYQYVQQPYPARSTIQNEPVDKPCAYATHTDEDYENYAKNNAENDAEAYYYDPPSDGCKSVIKWMKCRFQFDSCDKLIRHTQQEHEHERKTNLCEPSLEPLRHMLSLCQDIGS